MMRGRTSVESAALGGTAAFDLTTTALAAGQYDLTVYVWNRRTARWEDTRTVTISVR